MNVRVLVDGRAVSLPPNPLVLGTCPEADVDLGLRVGPERHASVEARADQTLWIRSLDPMPGTYTWVNGVAIADGAPLAGRDRVELGPFPPWCRPDASKPIWIRLRFEGLTDDGRWSSAAPADHLRTRATASSGDVGPGTPMPVGGPDSLAEGPLRPPIPGSIAVTRADFERMSDWVSVAGDLSIAGLRGPEVVSAPALAEVGGDLCIAGCPGIRRLEFPVLRRIGGRLMIDRLPDLEEISLPMLAAARHITIRSTSWLSGVVFPALVEVARDLIWNDNDLLGYIAVPRLGRARRICLRLNRVLSTRAIDELRADLVRRRVDGVVDAVGNGTDSFDRIVQQRLHTFGPAASGVAYGPFERFLRTAPELIEVHERMLWDADRERDRPAVVQRLQRLLELAQEQGDDRESNYDRALRFLVDPPANQEAEEWQARLEAAAGAGALVGNAARLWGAELSALAERPSPPDQSTLFARWRQRGTQRLLVPYLTRMGLHGVAARCAINPPTTDTAFWLWEVVRELPAFGWAEREAGSLYSTAVRFGRLISAPTLSAAAIAFVDLAVRTREPPVYGKPEARFVDPHDPVVDVYARAAGEWLSDDILSM